MIIDISINFKTLQEEVDGVKEFVSNNSYPSFDVVNYLTKTVDDHCREYLVKTYPTLLVQKMMVDDALKGGNKTVLRITNDEPLTDSFLNSAIAKYKEELASNNIDVDIEIKKGLENVKPYSYFINMSWKPTQ